MQARQEIQRRSAGFTLVEVIVTVAVLAIIGSLGYVVATEIEETSRVSKLQKDVATINSAVQVYKANGGNIPTSRGDFNQIEEAVLAALKTRADSGSGDQLAGVTGSFVDQRLYTSWFDADEDTSRARARWDATSERFVIAYESGIGISQFLLDDEAGAPDITTEARDVSLALGTSTGWVWDYSDAAPPTLGATGSNPTSAASRTPLSPPGFSPGAGESPLSAFDMSVTLTDPNPSGAAQIYYSVDGGPYIEYTAAVSTPPGTTIRALAAAVNPATHIGSDLVSGTYTATPVTLQVSITSPATSFTYAQAGGAMVSGTGAPPAAGVNLDNAGSIPPAYQSSEYFNVYYTTDGTDPISAGNPAPPFANGYVSPAIDISIGEWTNHTTTPTLTIQAVARAETAGQSFFNDSGVDTENLTASVTTLTAPIVTVGSNDVSVEADPGADYPVDFRIVYTTDGSSPISGTGPAATATVLPIGDVIPRSTFSGNSSELKTAIVGPAAYEGWFTPSNVITTPVSPGASGSLAGLIVNSFTNNGVINGSVQQLTGNSIQFNGSTEIYGDLYLPGTPNITGNRLAQMAPTIIEGNGSVTPSGYSVRFDAGVFGPGGNGTGTVYTRVDPDLSGFSELDAAYVNAVITGDSSGVPTIPVSNTNINVNGNQTRYIAPGNYGRVSVNNVLQVGNPSGPTVYNFRQLQMNGSSTLEILGPVTIFIRDGGQINNPIGTEENPDWLTIYSQGDIQINGGAGITANKVISTDDVTVNNDLDVTQGVIADSARINGGGVLNTGTISGD